MDPRRARISSFPMVEPGPLVVKALWKAGASFALENLREVFASNERAVLAKCDEVEAEFWGETNDQFRGHEARLSDLEHAALDALAWHDLGVRRKEFLSSFELHAGVRV
jgi:hypothetical protein